MATFLIYLSSTQNENEQKATVQINLPFISINFTVKMRPSCVSIELKKYSKCKGLKFEGEATKRSSNQSR